MDEMSADHSSRPKSLLSGLFTSLMLVEMAVSVGAILKQVVEKHGCRCNTWLELQTDTNNLPLNSGRTYAKTSSTTCVLPALPDLARIAL